MIKFMQQKSRYIFSSLCFVVGLYIFLSFVSFSANDPSIYISVYPTDNVYQNLGGALGAELSAHGYFQLGIACLALPVIFLLCSYVIIKSDKLVIDLGRIIGSSFCLVVISIYVFEFFQIPFSISGLQLSPGGWLGESVCLVMEKTFGKWLLCVLVLGGIGPHLMHSKPLHELMKKNIRSIRLFSFFVLKKHQLSSDSLVNSQGTQPKNRNWEWLSSQYLSLQRIPIFSAISKRFQSNEAGTLVPISSGTINADKELDKSMGSVFVDQLLISDQLFDSNPQVKKAAAFGDSEMTLEVVGSDLKEDQFTGSKHGSTSDSIVHGDETSLDENQVSIVDKAYVFPDLSAFKRPGLLHPPSLSASELKKIDDLLLKTLSDFGIKAEIIGHQTGPVVTVFEVRPEAGVKQARLLGLSDDLALSLKSDSLLIQPIPEKSALGIQVPNSMRADVLMGELLDHSTFARLSSPLSFVIGKSISGQPVYADLGAMPHLLVAGSTGSGKSVGINTLITSMLARSTPKDVRMILVDPKMLELSVYEGIPHLLMPVITQPEKATSALRWAVSEMERRYRIMQQMQVRNISAFNQAWLEASSAQRELVRLKIADEAVDTLPYIVLVIDELADLMMTAPKEIESIIQRLAQKARASGIHMVLATQRPSVDIITGVIKANLPSRIAFQVVSKHDSRTILDQMGAEKLLGKGDLLLQRPGLNKLERIQGAYISDAEVVALVKSIKDKNPAQYDQNLIDWVDREASSEDASDFQMESSSDDARWDDALEIAKSQGQVSASFLQRQLKIGYNRAARIVEQMERMGLVGKADGAKPRRWLGQMGEQKLF